MQITIRKDWMKLCGYGHIENRTYDVTFVFPGRLPDGTRMFDIDFNGQPWTVAEWRCESVKE